MRPESYIGITGFTEQYQVQKVLDSLPEALPDHPQQLVMIGLLMSDKTLDGEPPSNPRRYPSLARAGEIFTPHKRALNLVHFNTHRSERLLNDLLAARDAAGPSCRGIQLNMPYPDLGALREYKKTYLDDVLVLQCGSSALAPETKGIKVAAWVASNVEKYIGTVDYVLIDPSGGEGKVFDVQLAIDCFLELSRFPDLGMGIAGGLNGRNLFKLHRLSRLFGNYSIDVESGVRTEADEFSSRTAASFLKISCEIFKQRTLGAEQRKERAEQQADRTFTN